MLTISLITLGDPDRTTGGYLYHRRMADAAPGHDARVEFASFPDAVFPLPALWGGAVLNRVRRVDPDVVVLDSIAAVFLAPWLVVGRVPWPLVAILHQPPGGIDHPPLRARAQAALDRLAYRPATFLVAASEALADELIEGGVPAGRVRVVPPGSDTRPAGEGPPEDLRGGRRVAFVSVGNWVPRKGALELLDAFARLPAPAATLHLVGDDTLDRAYVRRVRARLARPDLAGRVVVHGRLPQARVTSLYQAADAFVLPSTSEPYGTVYGEALAAGLPVVGWRAGNLPHLAEDGREGVVLTPGDVAGLASALERLAVDDEYRRRLAAGARARGSLLPTWEESATQLFALFRRAAGGGQPRSGDG